MDTSKTEIPLKGGIIYQVDSEVAPAPFRHYVNSKRLLKLSRSCDNVYGVFPNWTIMAEVRILKAEVSYLAGMMEEGDLAFVIFNGVDLVIVGIVDPEQD